MHYLIGDLQGCDEAFERLLAAVGFSPSRDSLTLLGDLVNRGPASLAVLRRVHGMGDAAAVVLGNHDLHLLAVAAGARAPGRRDTFLPVLSAPDRVALLGWLRAQPLARISHGWLCVHAGVLPDWTADDTLARSQDVSELLSSPEGDAFLHAMYGDEPARWHPALDRTTRLRGVVNVLTRIRFCRADGTMDLQTKEGADAAPEGYRPWFEHETRRTATTPIAFGHWSMLGLLQRSHLLGLDTGCVWGGALSAVRVDGGRRELVQVRCTQAQRPAQSHADGVD